MDSTPQGPQQVQGTDRPKNASLSNSDARRTSSSSISQQPPLPPQPPPHATQSLPAAMASSSSRAGRGITPAASRSATKLVDADARPASRDSLKHKMLKQEAKKDDAASRPSRSDEQLTALKADFDSLRQHLTCKICDRLLYQPYTVACGHTYCYSCLCRWFVDNKARKTCPDCRVAVKELPAPAYVIRDMTTLFVARAELLPPDETIEDHKKWQKEEDDAVQADKDNKDPRTGGLFKGCFRHAARGPTLQVVRDQEDGVDRCPICTWELEDGGCQQCGLVFDDAGEVLWGDSFSGFSDMDEMSEHNTDDLDADMDMDDPDYDGYDGYDDAIWGTLPPEQSSFMMRRFLGAGGIPPNAAAFAARRRPVTHSEAGSRRSYSQSIVSDMYGDEMDTVEEEDEEEGDDENDSEMNDFIDDEEIAASSSASTESSTPGPTPQSTSQRSRARAARPVVDESETSSTISSVIEEEDEDEEDEGPIRRGVRNSAQTRALHRANGRPVFRAPSSTASHVSTEELDEDTQALLHEQGWMMQQDDDEMGEDDEDDSDGGRTTVGWEPLANSNDRSRMGGSLTPTADRPRPSAPIRPPSRTGNARTLDTSRGLRRRSSVLSTINYEDGEADDDDSDQDGVLDMAMHSLRARRSQAQMRNTMPFVNPIAHITNRGNPQGDGVNDQDTDENSDNSQLGQRRRIPRIQRREYDPRISWMFAAHQQALQQHHMAGALIDIESRAITPIARPRTRNRNGPSPAQAYSPFQAPTRLRTPLMDNTSNMGGASRMPMSPPRRSAMSPALPAGDLVNMSRNDRTSSISSSSNASAILTPGTSTPSSQQSIDSTAQLQAALAMDMIDRPISRVSARPSSAAGRRNSAGFSPVNPSFAHAGMGLHVQGGALPPFQARGGNPWAGFLRAQAQGLRNRNSRQVLRNESSTATLRPASSRANMREPGAQQQAPRPQASRINLRPQPSRRQLNPQASTRTLRASEHARPPSSPAQTATAASQSAARPRALTQDERNTRARELIETRTRALVQPSNAPARNNPFYQRPANPMAANIMQGPPTTHHVRSNSNESMQSVNSNGTIQGAPSSPGLQRRRSTRNVLNATPPGALPPAQTSFSPPVPAYSNQYYRPQRQAVLATYESPTLNTHLRNSNPVMAGNLI